MGSPSVRISSSFNKPLPAIDLYPRPRRALSSPSVTLLRGLISAPSLLGRLSSLPRKVSFSGHAGSPPRWFCSEDRSCLFSADVSPFLVFSGTGSCRTLRLRSERPSPERRVAPRIPSSSRVSLLSRQGDVLLHAREKSREVSYLSYFISFLAEDSLLIFFLTISCRVSPLKYILFLLPCCRGFSPCTRTDMPRL